MSKVGLHHGTDLVSANHLLQHGLDAAAAARYNATGEFWATTNVAVAEWFARSNPAGGVPARFDFEIPESLLQHLLAQGPLVAIAHTQEDYEFLPPSFEILNQCMTNKQVVLVP
jgi:hypothetical protein